MDSWIDLRSISSQNTRRAALQRDTDLDWGGEVRCTVFLTNLWFSVGVNRLEWIIDAES